MSAKWFEILDSNGRQHDHYRSWAFVNIDTGNMLRANYVETQHPYHDVPCIECEINGKVHVIWLGEPIPKAEKPLMRDVRDSVTQAISKARTKLLAMVADLNGNAAPDCP